MSRRGTNIRKRADGRWEGRYYIVDTAGSALPFKSILLYTTNISNQTGEKVS